MNYINIQSVNMQYERFLNTILCHFKASFPLKRMKRQNSCERANWTTGDVRQSSNKLKHLYHISKTDSPELNELHQ